MNETAKAPVLYTKEDLTERFHLSRAQIDRLREDEDSGFPEGVPIYGRKLVWKVEEVDAWLEQLFAKPDKRRAA